MKKLDILTEGMLPKEVSRRVVFGQDNIEAFAKDLFFTMKMAGGIGLAAPQVGQMLRIIAVDTSKNGGSVMGIMINPEISGGSETVNQTEGCLSFPGKFVKTTRKGKIHLVFQDFQGNTKTRTLTGLDAVCVQHEIDHLDGKTMWTAEDKNAR